MARLRAEVIAERQRVSGSAGEQRTKLVAAIKRNDAQVTRIVNAMTEAGHNPAPLAKLTQLQQEAGKLEARRDALNAAEPPAPLIITDDVHALIQAAARDIERAISHPAYPDAMQVRKMVRRMIERITINRHESGAIEVVVRGAFAGVLQAAGLVERHALGMRFQNEESPGAFASGLLIFMFGCGGRI